MNASTGILLPSLAAALEAALDPRQSVRVPDAELGAFLHQVARHQLISTVNGLLRVGQLQLPASTADVIRAHARRQAAISMLLERELAAIDDELCEHEIDFLLLKGPALALTLYPQPEWRAFGDLDILIHREDFAATDSVLQTRGVAPTLRMSTRRRLRHFGTVEYAAPERSHFRVDLHWNDLSASWSNLSVLTHPGVWTNAVPVGVGGHTIKTLGPVHNLIYLCVHWAYHHQFDRLSIMLDILLQLKALGASNQSDALQLARSCRATRAASLSLHLARRALGGLPPGWDERAWPHPGRTLLRLAEWQLLSPHSWLERIVKALSLDGNAQRARALARYLMTRLPEGTET